MTNPKDTIDGEPAEGHADRYRGNPSRRYPEGRPLCGAQKRSENRDGEHCRNTAGHNTPHAGRGPCSKHGGNTRNHLVAAQNAEVKELAGIYGIPRQLDPREGILEEYYRTAGLVSRLELIVAQIPQAELVWGVVEEQDGTGDGDSGGFAKRTSKAVPNAWVTLLNEERNRFARLGVDIVKLGLEARRDEWMRSNGIAMSDVFRRAITRAGVDGDLAQQLMDALIAEISDEVTRLAGPKPVAA